MIVTLAPTQSFARINGVMCRRWCGVTMHGVEVVAWIARVMPLTLDPNALKAFDEALHETEAPKIEAAE